MKFFLDTEFIEGFKKPISWLPTIDNFNKPYHSIQLISIGLVCEDGREYYAISNEFKISDASKWVWDNVLHGIYKELLSKENYARTYHWDLVEPFNKKTLATLIKWHGKSNAQIANEILNFVHGYTTEFGFDTGGTYVQDANYWNLLRKTEPASPPVFYANYADYDWVLFCSLFGNMMDLPKGFPMYCRDLKQMLDEKQEATQNVQRIGWVEVKRRNLNTEDAFDIKMMSHFPQQTNEHNALSDAKFNLELYNFIQKL